MQEELIIQKIENECRRIEEDAEHSFKAHYNAAEFWSSANLMLGLPAAVLGVMAGGASATDGSQAAVTGTAFLASALVTCLTFLKPSEKSDSHKNAGNFYQSLRNRARLFRELELNSITSIDDVKQKFMQIVERRDDLNSTMPAIPRAAYEKAKKDIDMGRSKYLVDTEVNK